MNIRPIESFLLSKEELNILDPDGINGFTKLYSGGALREVVGAIKQTLKDIGHVLYMHRDITIPETGKNLFDSFNHYRGLASNIEKEVNKIEYYGEAYIPEKRKFKFNFKNDISKFDKFINSLELLEYDREVKDKLGEVDSNTIKKLNIELGKLVFEAKERVWNTNYFKFMEIQEEAYFNIPEPALFEDANLFDNVIPDLELNLFEE